MTDILRTQQEIEQAEMQRLRDEIGGYMDFILDPSYPERLSAVLEKAQEEAAAVRHEAQNICVKRSVGKRFDFTPQPKHIIEGIEKAARVELKSGKLQPSREDYQRAFEVRKTMNELTQHLAKGVIRFDPTSPLPNFNTPTSTLTSIPPGFPSPPPSGK